MHWFLVLFTLWYTSDMTVLVHLIYRVEEIWPTGPGRWLVWYGGGCVKSHVPVAGCDRLGSFDIRGSRNMADDGRQHSQRHLSKDTVSNSYSWTRLRYNHYCYVQKFATEQAIYHYLNQSFGQRSVHSSTLSSLVSLQQYMVPHWRWSCQIDEEKIRKKHIFFCD